MRVRLLVFFATCHPSALLLLAQLLGMVLYPFAEQTRAAAVVFNGFGLLILGATVRMVRRTPWLTWVSVVLAVAIIGLLSLQMFLDIHHLQPWISALEAVFYFYAAGSLTAYIMGDRQTTTDELFAAAATFTLLAWGFTHLYMMVQALQPGTYAAAVNAAAPRTWTELNYLSFALLSSTGIGDVIPLTGYARALAAVEMFVGVMYLAVIVARLIGFAVASGR